ncbi:ABC transporter ATP-binding protein/permease [Microbacterium sp. EYE_5]|uniref:ATP-binding cassette domain-containing protein n=1 Tax=unclassified Microbacterium TaxID=2609290 RepID=UPI002003F153|nr:MULTISPECIES: ABC transporter ATP-binding protein [unclassified Microbacterium]MCK6080627.1 ABC transporter ATP-binding protein/permease [Microbacterium sp. EYE_382]MCK6085898.1 ABC transporter ATP-binding protein/permease [Microbacterium sp. EYE_384]MCK6124604.1 ABC transporter ATP-binding protein/permease [Microbacterium sp. EYE_80]MCK6127513.1 ABC transporter ATP-binding protein/permease [Microbacterium sp. EYE_79]MCK6141582.1 ABC transporter ATP-binding protein/permease [Microbacterium 
MAGHPSRRREIASLAAELGPSVPIYLVLQIAFGFAPAGLILLTATAVGPSPPPVPVLVAWLGGILLIGTIADAVSPGLRSQIGDRTSMVLRRRWMTKVAFWRTLRVFEEPELVRLRSEAERAIAALVNVPVLLGLITASLAGIAPVAGAAVSISPWIVLAAVAGGLPLAFGLSALYRRAWDARSVRLPLVLRGEGLADAATDARAASDLRSFELAPWVSRSWLATQTRLLREVGAVRRRTTVHVTAWSLVGTGILIAALFALVPAESSPADLVILIGLLLQVTTSLAVLVQAAGDLAQVTRPLQAYLAFVTHEEESPLDAAEASWMGTREAVYTYPGAAAPSLDRLTCRFEPRALNVVVGPNGAGKSTLIRLLDETSEPDRGSVSLGTRGQRAVMHQDFARFPFSVRENVTAGRNHDDADVWEVLDVVGLSDKVRSLPSGLDAPLHRDSTDTATELSGGQWQRLAVARLLLRARTADIVVLDEPTAALDALSEIELLDRVMQLLVGKTVILVTHRMQWARRAARIVEVTSPSRAREGTHEELLRLGGWYADAFAAQASAFTD